MLSSFLLSSFSFQPLQRPSVRDSPHTAIKSSQRDAANGVIDQMIKDTETRARATKAKPLTIADIEAVMRLGVANSKIYAMYSAATADQFRNYCTEPVSVMNQEYASGDKELRGGVQARSR